MKYVFSLVVAMMLVAPGAQAATFDIASLLAQIEQLQKQIAQLEAQEVVTQATDTTSDLAPAFNTQDTDSLVVVTNGETVFNSVITDAEEARITCRDIAYNPDNLFLTTKCVYDGIVIHNAKFIAG